LQLTRSSPKGTSGQYFVVKRTFTNVIFDIRISQIQDQKITQPNVHIGCIVPCSYFMSGLNISRRGLSRVAYPGQGNARARMWDKREVEHPRLSV